MAKTSSLSLSPLNFYNFWLRHGQVVKATDLLSNNRTTSRANRELSTMTPLSWVRIPVLQPIFSFKIPFSLAQWWYIGSIPIACLTLRSGKVKLRTLRFSRSNLRTWWVCVSWYNNSSISSLWQRWVNQLYLVWRRSASLPPPYGMVV